MNRNKKNKEGYIDMTAYHGLKEHIRMEAELDRQVRELNHSIRKVAAIAGFEIENRIVFRHKRSGKVFR